MTHAHSRDFLPPASQAVHGSPIRRPLLSRVTAQRPVFLALISLCAGSSALAFAPAAAPASVTITDPTAATAAGIAPAIPAYDGPALNVVVSLPPLRGLVEGLLPKGSRVGVLVPVGASEHAFEIPPSRLAEMSKADLVVTVGMGLEPQVEKWLTARPSPTRAHVRFEDVANALDQKPVEAAGGTTTRNTPAHDHDDHSGHAHDEHGNCIHHHGVDPHLWLDPVLCKSLVDHAAREIDRLLSERSQSGAGESPSTREQSDAQSRAESLEKSRACLELARLALHAQLDTLDASLRQLASEAAKSSRAFVVGHDAYGRWTERYGLKTIPLAGMHATEPSPAAIQKAIESIRSLGPNAGSVYVEPQLSRGSAERIAKSTGATIRVLDPLGDGDYFKTMRANIDALRSGLTTTATSSP